MINEVTSKFVCTIWYNHAVDPKHLNHIKMIGRFLFNVRLVILEHICQLERPGSDEGTQNHNIPVLIGPNKSMFVNDTKSVFISVRGNSGQGQ
jgi:hypothetical protein